MNNKWLFFLLPLFPQAIRATLFITADCDLRFNSIDFKRNEFQLASLGLSLRKVIADAKADRLILFGLGEIAHNFKKTHLHQFYCQYKGPLAKWNLTLGRYRLPFGLLANYSSERLLIETIEDRTIGFSSDNGLQLSGFLGNFDYALSISQGVGAHLENIKEWGIITFRAAHQGNSFGEFSIGLSGLFGRVRGSEDHSDAHWLTKRLLALDLTKHLSQAALRTEIVLGQETRGEKLVGIFSQVDHLFLPRLDLNLGFHYLNKSEKSAAITFGLSYNLLLFFQLRIAQKLSLQGDENVFTIQIYSLYNWTF